MEKVKQLFEAIVSAEAWYIAGSPLLGSITNVDKPNGDPENEVLLFTWIGDEEATEFSESIGVIARRQHPYRPTSKGLERNEYIEHLP
jgi:hypothetical protein